TAPEPVGQSLVSGASQTSAPVKETEEADNLQEVPYKEAPQKPRDDRQYLSIEQRIKSVAKKEKEILIPAEAKRDEIPKASVLPVAKEKKRRAYRKHNQEISGVKKEDTPYTVEGFLADFKKSVEEGLKKKNQLLDNYNGDIGINESQSRKSLKEYDETQGAAKLKKITGTPVDGFHDSAGEDFSEPVAVQTEQVGKQPHVSAPERAVPKPTTPQQISLEPFSQALDEPFAKKEVKESWLANSDNDEYKAAYQKKVTAQTNLANIPVEFKTKTEAPTLVDSKSSAAQDINSATKSSHQLRTETLGTASKTQAEAVGTIKKGKEADYSAFEAIFEETNTKVKTALASIRDVQSSFEAILQDAKTEFKKEADKFQGYLYPSFYVVRRTWPDSENPVREKAQKGFVAEGNRLYPDNPFQAIAYAKERSSEYIYGRLKEQYATKVMFEMQVLAIFIVGKLNEARTAIKEGERKAKEANEKLPNADEQSNKAYETIKTRFTNLRESVDGQRSMLLQGMSQAYIETEGQLRGIYDKAHAEAQKTWLDDVVEFVEEIVDAIAEFAGQIRQLLGSVIHLLDYIVTHPIRFFEDLSAGIREGFSGFVEKIDVHLATAFLDWLRGNNQKSSNPIEIPEQFDGMGLFSLFTQLLRLNRETLWERVELKFGKKVTDFLRKGVGLAEKGLEIFSIYREKGLGGLWDYVKGSLDSMVGGMLTQLQETVVFELVKKAIAKIALLFVPGGGFVAIAKMIIDALSFLYHNRNSILQLIEMFISTLEYAAIGNIEKIVELVVSGLTRFMTLSIDFLARIFNLGNLNDMVQRVLETIRNPIIRAIDFVLDQLKKIIDKLFGTGQEAEKPQVGDLADSEVGEPLEFSADGEPHRLWISTAGQGVETMMRSEEISVDKQLGNMAKETNDLPEASQSEAKSLLSIAKQQNKSVEKEGAETKKEMAEAGKNPEPQEVQQAEKADEETVAAEEALKNTLIKLLELFENIFAIADKFKSEIHRLHPEVAEHILNAVEKQPDKYEDMEAW
ncbi:MAG TPA: hypothetical protein PLC41_07675, partial [Bacteroidales bacterium]|nr:hypothetical protein [Bacteroidales bacterium]